MRVHVLVFICSKCQEESFEKITPKCLCENTSFICIVSIKTEGWCGLKRFLGKIIASDFAGLKPFVCPVVYFFYISEFS